VRAAVRRASAALAFAAAASCAGDAFAAGTVRVARTPQGWEIVGDDSANVITVRTASEADGVVTLSVEGGAATVVQGPGTIVLHADDGLRIRMAGGDDVLRLGAEPTDTGAGVTLHVPRTLRIDLGPGADELTGRNVETTSGAILVGCGPDDDVVDLQRCTAGGRVQIRGGPGNDTVTLGAAGVAADTRIDGGLGNDAVTVTDLVSVRGLVVLGGFGADTLRLAGTIDARGRRTFLDGGPDNDQFLASGTSILGALRVHGRAGNDTVGFAGVTCRKDAAFFGESGNDVLTVGIDAQGGGLQVLGALGNDQVTLSSCRAIRPVRIDLGDGDDRLTTGTSVFADDATYVGGPGTDTLLPGAGDTSGGKLRTKGFERQD
jgi:hypothetical protein